MVSEILPGQNFKGQGHYSQVKGKIKAAYLQLPNQCPYQVTTFYSLRFLRYSPDKIFKAKITTVRSNQCHTMMLHIYNP